MDITEGVFLDRDFRVLGKNIDNKDNYAWIEAVHDSTVFLLVLNPIGYNMPRFEARKCCRSAGKSLSVTDFEKKILGYSPYYAELDLFNERYKCKHFSDCWVSDIYQIFYNGGYCYYGMDSKGQLHKNNQNEDRIYKNVYLGLCLPIEYIME